MHTHIHTCRGREEKTDRNMKWSCENFVALLQRDILKSYMGSRVKRTIHFDFKIFQIHAYLAV